MVAGTPGRHGVGSEEGTTRVFETWRVVETVTETARETLTQTETVSVSVSLGAARPLDRSLSFVFPSFHMSNAHIP